MALPSKNNVTQPLAWGYDALLEYGPDPEDSMYLRLAVGPQRELRQVSVDPGEGGRGLDVAATPEDMRPESGQTFSRTDFSGGEGLARAHVRGGSERDWSRFWDSRNIDVTPTKPGVPSKLRLLHETELVDAADNMAVRAPLHLLGSALFGVVSDDAEVEVVTDPTGATPGQTTEDPGGTGPVTDIAVLGDEVYAAQGEIRRRSNTGVWGAWSDLAATRLWSVKNRIVGSDGRILYEARSGSGSVVLHTLPPGEVWNDVADAGSAILAAASDGYLYAFADEDGELVLRRQTLIEGEYPTALVSAQGLLFIGTGQPTPAGGVIGRLYRAAFVGLGLRDAQVVRVWGDESTTVDLAPKRLVADRESVWTAIPDGSETHLWRYHLPSAGMVRDLIFGAAGQADGIVSVGGRMFVNLRAVGLYREATTYAASGYLIGPAADFFNAAPKVWVGARVTIDTLPNGTAVDLSYTTDPDALTAPSTGWTSIISDATAGDVTERPIQGVQSRYIAGKVTLTANTAKTATPEVAGYSFRGLPLPTEVDWSIPVNVSDRLELPHRKPVLVKNLGQDILDALDGLKGKNMTVTLLRTGQQLVGQLRSVGAPIYGQPERGSITVYALATFRGVMT